MRKSKGVSSHFEEKNKVKLAMLIDGDNAQAKIISKVLAEVGKYGAVTVRRIYGDWTTNNMNSWKNYTNNYAIQPIQQFGYTTGKNATDSALIIDAMDILHSGLVEGFCIVSSDSDYTRLATRIRESGIFVMGVGEKKTPKAFVNACNVFIYTEILRSKRTLKKSSPKKNTNNTPNPAPLTKKETSYEFVPEVVEEAVEEVVESPVERVDPVPLLIEAYEVASGDEDWVSIHDLSTQLLRLDPSFDARAYGYERLPQLVRAYPHRFDFKNLEGKDDQPIMVKLKEF